VAGISKRGWITYLVGATECRGCNISVDFIAPLVPIIPDLLKDVHRMWKAYNGFTFAFNDYLDADLAAYFDGEKLAQAWQIIDPIHFMDRLEKIPKFVTVSSNDEFMMMDQTAMYWD
jgi:PhoPQ-activated pathogenicity-related protein